MDISEFFSLRIDLGASRYVQVGGEELLAVGEKDVLSGNYAGVNLPLRFNQKYGRKWGDLVGTGWLSLYLISTKFRAALEENKLTGWQTFSVEVFNKRKIVVEGFYGLSIIGKCGPINYSKSEMMTKRLVPTGPLVNRHRGLHVGLDQWDGMDFFIPFGSTHIIASPRAATIIEDGHFENVRLENLADVEIPEVVIQNC